jgi:hypothetical protein
MLVTISQKKRESDLLAALRLSSKRFNFSDDVGEGDIKDGEKKVNRFANRLRRVQTVMDRMGEPLDYKKKMKELSDYQCKCVSYLEVKSSQQRRWLAETPQLLLGKLMALGYYIYDHLTVRRSDIPNAGNGVFVIDSLPSGTMIPFEGWAVENKDNILHNQDQELELSRSLGAAGEYFLSSGDRTKQIWGLVGDVFTGVYKGPLREDHEYIKLVGGYGRFIACVINEPAEGKEPSAVIISWRPKGSNYPLQLYVLLTRMHYKGDEITVIYNKNQRREQYQRGEYSTKSSVDKTVAAAKDWFKKVITPRSKLQREWFRSIFISPPRLRASFLGDHESFVGASYQWKDSERIAIESSDEQYSASLPRLISTSSSSSSDVPRMHAAPRWGDHTEYSAWFRRNHPVYSFVGKNHILTKSCVDVYDNSG